MELVNEYIPERSTMVITDFYHSYAETLVQGTNIIFWILNEQLEDWCLNYYVTKKYINEAKNAYKYKVYLLIDKVSPDQIPKSNKNIDYLDWENLQKEADQYELAYPELYSYSGYYEIHNGERIKDSKGNYIFYELYNQKAYTFSELKKMHTNNDSSICQIVIRTIYNNFESIKESISIDLDFKVPFSLYAKTVDDVGFDGFENPKTQYFNIRGIRIIKKRYCGYGASMLINARELYFKEEYSDIFEMIKKDNMSVI